MPDPAGHGDPAAAADPAPDLLPPRAPTPLRRALFVLLRLLGVALLVVVLAKVPWRDRVHLADGRVLEGTLLREEPDGSLWFAEAGAAEGRERWLGAAELATRPRSLPAGEEGILTLARRLSVGTGFLVLLLSGVGIGIASLRWRLLLGAQGIHLRRREAFGLTLLGNFFHQVAPGGIVGGDVVKSVYAARGRGSPAACAVSVLVDRVLGLFGTVVLACAALLPRWDDPRFHGHALLAYGVLGAGILGSFLLLSRRVRRVLGVERWVPRLPLVGRFLGEADAAVMLYRRRKGAVVMALGVSVLIHASWCLGNALLGGMLGIDLTLGDWFAVVPPILVVSAIPLLPGGWGVGEASYVFFLGLLGVPPAPAVAVSVLGRSLQMLTALPGGIVFLARRR